MFFKVTISDKISGTASVTSEEGSVGAGSIFNFDAATLAKSVQSVTFYANPPDDIYDRHTTEISSMSITGKIGAEDSTVDLYKWALLPASDPKCYKKVEVEQANAAGQVIRKVSFPNAFVVDYSESYSKGTGAGVFTLFVRQLDIDEDENDIKEERSTTEYGGVVARVIKAKIKNLGVSASGKKLEGMNLEINEKFRGDQFKVEDSFDASIDKAKHSILTAANCKTTCALNENLDGHLSTNDNIKLSDIDKSCLEELANYRKDISPIKADTIVQKVIDKDQLDAYLNKDNPKVVISGCVSKASDVAPFTNNADEAYKNLRLDYNGNNFKEQAENGGEMYVMRCTSGFSPGNDEHPVINAYTSPPCTGTGFLGSESHLLPEYTYGRGHSINEGAIFKVDKNGNEAMCAAWDDDLKRFVKID